MGYLAYLYDTKGELIEVGEVETPDQTLAYLSIPTMIELDRQIASGEFDLDAPLPIRQFVKIDQGRTVRGLPRVIYQERA